jgi:hypothetical protein
MAKWYILWTFGIFCGHLLFFPRFGKMYREKSGNPDLAAEENWCGDVHRKKNVGPRKSSTSADPKLGRLITQIFVLHPKQTSLLRQGLCKFRNIGNSVLTSEFCSLSNGLNFQSQAKGHLESDLWWFVALGIKSNVWYEFGTVYTYISTLKNSPGWPGKREVGSYFYFTDRSRNYIIHFFLFGLT